MKTESNSHSELSFIAAKSNESIENYLEAILMLSQEHPVVRSVDIAEGLGYKKSSVSVAMKKLRERGDIVVTREGYIYLTESGKAIAEGIYERHIFLAAWLMEIGVSSKTAHDDACRIEHFISDETFKAIKAHAKAEHADVYQETRNAIKALKKINYNSNL